MIIDEVNVMNLLELVVLDVNLRKSFDREDRSLVFCANLCRPVEY